VVQNKSFLDVLVSKIDPSNATKDVFSLGLTQPKSSTPSTSGNSANPVSPINGEVSATAFASKQAIGFAESVNGLSDLGTLAIAAAPGAQNLMASQIGTLQQRMGALSQPLKGGVSLWARVFGDSGTVDPTHSANNFGQGGHFGFDQSNTGEELGIDVAFTDELKAGLLVAKEQANQHLDDGNAGSSRIKGTTGGAYATWIAPTGMYLDASFRAMRFTSRLNAASGQAWVKGDADAFNLETGKTWTLDSGLQIAPQLQYTWNTVNHISSVSDTLAGFRSSDDTSSRGRLGVMVSKSYTAADAGTIWMPYVSVSAVHEFDGKNHYTINNTFSGQTGTAGTSALVTAGVNVTMHKLSFYGGANWLDGGAMKSFLGGQVGLRYSW
jgi:outer membrane autotransporter protein